MIMKMEKFKDNEYNYYVCYLPNCGEDYKEGDIVETPEWVKRKYKLWKIYCIEKQWVEDPDIHNKFNNNCEFWNCIEEPWKVGCWDFVEEYDDEERFKNDILNTINRGGIISKVWIKEVSDNYKTSKL